MADEQQVATLLSSVEAWDEWREIHEDEPVDLAGASLGGADLQGADLFDADLRAAELGRASLVGACLVGADLRGATLFVTDLRGADLRGARLQGADLSRSLFLTQPQIEGAAGDLDTMLPAGLRRPRHWSG